MSIVMDSKQLEQAIKWIDGLLQEGKKLEDLYDRSWNEV